MLEKLESADVFFRPGLTWPRRTTKGLGFRVLPSGCIFADKGPAAFVEGDDPTDLLALLAVTVSAPFRHLVELQMCFGSYEVGVIQRTPVPELSEEDTADLAARVEGVLEIALRGCGESAVGQAVEVLSSGSHDLRPWLARGFFDEHLKRHSKSRRKAPLYWQLATPSASYSLWLYAHRVSRDTLYRAVDQHVMPRIRHEERRLEALRSEGGETPPAALRRKIEGQEGFLGELQALREELLRETGAPSGMPGIRKLPPTPRAVASRSTSPAPGRGSASRTRRGAPGPWPPRRGRDMESGGAPRGRAA